MRDIFSKAGSGKRSNWRFFPREAVERFHVCQNTGNIDDILRDAGYDRGPMKNFGDALADHLGGEFILGPNKTRERSLAGVVFDYNWDIAPDDRVQRAHGIIDPVRGCILVDDLADVTPVRKKIRSITDYRQDVILQIEDRTSVPVEIGLCGIFLAVRPGNGVVGEIQIHTREYWAGLSKIRHQYDDYRQQMEKVYLQMHEEKTSQPSSLKLGWEVADKLYLRKCYEIRKQGLRKLAVETGLSTLDLTHKNFDGNCAFPLRPALHEETQQHGFLIPSYCQRELVNSKFAGWRPKSSICSFDGSN